MDMKNSFLIVGIFLFVFSFVSAAPSYSQKMMADSEQTFILDSFDIGTLDQLEIDGLTLMREEEKLARDVYLYLFEETSLPIFSNIASSEQTHMDAVLVILERYGLEDPSLIEQGAFSNSDLQVLYMTLVEQGKVTLLDALIVGATIEDLDIYDLNRLILETDKEDLKLVYKNLVKGSRNHLRSFVSQIESNGGNYTAQYISEEELLEIVSSSSETGSILDENSNVVSSFNSRLRNANSGQSKGVISSKGNLFQTRQMENSRFEISSSDFRAKTGLKIIEEGVLNATILRTQLSNGRNAEIKVMPDAASETALERLRLNNCVEEEGCNIELKEVGTGQNVRAAYEIQTQRNSKLFGLFNMPMKVQAQVDAETGEVIQTNKPWWAIFASEPSD